MLKIKTMGPDFKLLDQNGKERSLNDHPDSYALIYFYPKDDTPGCTKEACAISEIYEDFKSNGVEVFGISSDSVESHKRFAEKYHLPFTLLSDPKKEAINAYGAGGAIFSKRITYLIDPHNLIVKVYSDVDPEHHGAQILKDIYVLKNVAK